MVDYAQVGQQTGTGLGTGIQAPLRMGPQSDLIVSEYHGRYYNMTRDGKGFSVAAQAAVTTTVGLATTYTGLSLANPVGSGINVVLNKCSMMQSVIQATQVEAYAIAIGYNATTNVTHTTPQTPQSNLIGSGLTAIAKADVSSTLPTAPLYDTFFTNTGTTAADSTGVQVLDFEGLKILTPGAYACFVTPAQASVSGMWFSFSWEEIAITL